MQSCMAPPGNNTLCWKSTWMKHKLFQLCFFSWLKKSSNQSCTVSWSFLTNKILNDPRTIRSFFPSLSLSLFLSRCFPGCVRRISTRPCWRTWRRRWATRCRRSCTRSPPTDPPPSWPPITCCSTSSAGARKEPRPARFTPHFQTRRCLTPWTNFWISVAL